MKKLVLAATVFTALSAFAAPSILLEKIQSSGYVMPQYRFARNCTILSNGKMRIEIKKPSESGEWQTKVTNIQLSQKLTQTIKSQLMGAAMGEIIELPMPCDVGTRILRGHYNQRLVEIDSALDCNSHKFNKSESAKRLKDLSLRLCQF